LRIKTAFDLAVEHLSHIENPSLEAGYLLAAMLKQDRSYIYSHFEELLDDTLTETFKSWIQKRAEGMPLAYLVGEKTFWEYDFRVTQDTLIPRPETELLVEAALKFLPKDVAISVADLGTGSGAVAVVLKKMRPNWEVYGVDSSNAALKIAEENASKLGVKVNFAAGHWSSEFPAASMDALVSNPPYLRENDPHLKGEIAFEPRSALVAGKDGLDAYREILEDSKRVLKPEGFLFFEHGYNQAQALIALLQSNNFFVVKSIVDYQRHPRIIVAQMI